MNNFIADTLELMRSDGLMVDNLVADAAWHRCQVDGKQRRNSDGSYKYFPDDNPFPPTVIWNNFLTGISGKNSAKAEKDMTATQRKAYKKMLAEAQKERQAEETERYNEAAKKAQADWDKAKKATDSHFYLKLKKVKSYGLRMNDKGELLIPIFGDRGQLQSYERILPSEKDNKRFFTGGKKKGGYFPIQAADKGKTGPLLIAEGYATGASIHEATGYAVLIAFDADNLLPVAQFARRKYKTRAICICADYDIPKNDRERELYPEPGGKGVAKAKEAAQAIGAFLAICPDIEGGKADFNDLFVKYGLERVRQEIEKAMRERPLKNKPIIIYRPGQIIRILNELEAAIHEHVFQNGGRLVNVIKLPQDKMFGKIELKAGMAVINPLDTDSLCVIASKYADWLKHDARKEIDVPCDPPTKIIKSLNGNKGFWNLQPLFGLTTSPIIRANGSILGKAGYDSETGIYADFDPTIFPPIPENPTMQDAENALAILKDAITEFPFESGKGGIDEAVALAAMLTAVARPSLPTAPLFAFSAPCPRTGKTTLANVMAIMATGKEAPAFNYTSDPDELKKAFFSLLSYGAQVVLIDNATGIINNPTMNTVMSQCELTDRILGQNDKTMTVSTKALFMITGNNLILAEDMIGRTVFCTLDANMERPSERVFANPDFTKWLLDNRANLVMAALTILRAYYVVEDSDKVKLPPLNNYVEWSRLVRDALVWLGEADPVKSQRKIESNDPERELLRNVLTAWWDYHQDSPVQVKDLLDCSADMHETDDFGHERSYLSDEKQELYQAILATTGNPKGINTKSLGRWLSSHQKRPVGDLRLVRGPDFKNVATWRVEKI